MNRVLAAAYVILLVAALTAIANVYAAAALSILANALLCYGWWRYEVGYEAVRKTFAALAGLAIPLTIAGLLSGFFAFGYWWQIYNLIYIVFHMVTLLLYGFEKERPVVAAGAFLYGLGAPAALMGAYYLFWAIVLVIAYCLIIAGLVKE